MSMTMDDSMKRWSVRRKSALVVEIMFGRLKLWRRIATRYERCPIVVLSAIAVTAILLLWL